MIRSQLPDVLATARVVLWGMGLEVFLRDFLRFLGREPAKGRGFVPGKSYGDLDEGCLDLRERLILEVYRPWDLEKSSGTNSHVLAICSYS